MKLILQDINDACCLGLLLGGEEMISVYVKTAVKREQEGAAAWDGYGIRIRLREWAEGVQLIKRRRRGREETSNAKDG